MKKTLTIVLALCCLLFAITAVHALDADITEVEINGVTVDQESDIRLDIEKGGTIDVRVEYETQERAEVRVEVKIFDPDGRDIEAQSDLRSTRADRTYYEDLQLTLPRDFDEGNYRLRLRLVDPDSSDVDADYNLYINSPRHDLEILDLITHPFGVVSNKDFLFVKARIASYSQEDEENIRVRVFLDDGREAVSYIDEIEDDNSGKAQDDTEEMLISLGCDVPEGPLTLHAEASYNRGRDVASFEKTIFVKEDPSCTEDTTITQGQQADMPATLNVNNQGTPQGGIDSDNRDSPKEENDEGKGITAKRVLEVLLIVLVVFFILIAIIVAIYKLRGDDDE